MGLAQGVKAYLQDAHPDCFLAPEVRLQNQVLIQDCMYKLYQLKPATGSALVRAFAAIAREFASAGGDRTIVFCFDRDEDVPRAKAQTQRARRSRRRGAEDAAVTTEISPYVAPTPWLAALSDFEVRRRVVLFLKENLAAALRDLRATVVISGPGDRLRVGHGHLVRDEAPRVGEADLSTAVYANAFAGQRVCVMGIDTDAIAILCMQAMLRGSAALSFYFDMGDRPDGTERRTVVDITGLSRRVSLSLWLLVILMGTDFTTKVQKGTSVAETLRAFASAASEPRFVVANERELGVDLPRLSAFLSTLRGTVQGDLDLNVTRALWVLATWRALNAPDLTEHGWDADGAASASRATRTIMPDTPSALL